ncbi:apolipoprotein N-acyltransferase [bacterium]|nr:apolipoprotein N-acyltransferase [bacterium]
MFKISEYKNLSLSFISGILLAISFPKIDFEYGAWIALVPLFLILVNVDSKKAFTFSYVTGVVFFASTIYWISFVSTLGTVLLVLYLSLYIAVFGVLTNCLFRKLKFPLAFIAPPVWILLEFARAHLLTGFPWALLGYSQYKQITLIQSASFISVYGISCLIVLINASIADVWLFFKNRRGDWRFLICPVLSVIAVIVFFIYGNISIRTEKRESVEESIKVGIVQPNIMQEEKAEDNYSSRERVLNVHLNLSEKLLKFKPDIIIWPETALTYVDKYDEKLITKLKNFAKHNNLHLLTGVCYRSLSTSKFYNSVFLFAPNSAIRQRYDKIHLVPFGEYIPIKNLFPFLSKVVPIGDFDRGKEYTVLNFYRKGKLDSDRKIKFACTICFENIFSDFTRQFVRNGAQFLVNVTNDSWFGNSKAPYQHMSMSVFRAVENRIPVIFNANTGVSCFIDKYGRISNRVNNSKGDIFIAGTGFANVSFNNKKTFYTKYGNLFVIFNIIWLIILTGIYIFVRIAPHPSLLPT